MDKYIYRGENEQIFFVTFTANIDPENYACCLSEDDDMQDKEYGTIIVPKDYENCWIAMRHYYLGWQIVIAPVAAEFVKGYNDDNRWIVLKEGKLQKLADDLQYYILQSPEKEIYADTLSSFARIAENKEEFEKLTPDQLESIIYSNEMNTAR